ncbi:hypothetical protein Hanom_Chr09g00811911 [Helianthus anomalus]
MLCSRDPLNRGGEGRENGFFLPDNSLSNLERHGGEGRDGEGFLTREHTPRVQPSLSPSLYSFLRDLHRSSYQASKSRVC